MRFNREEYAKEYRRISRINPMTASCPPADDLASLRDSAIEAIAEDNIQEAIADPDIMLELVLENGYDQEGLHDMAAALSAMMGAVLSPTGNKEIALDSRMYFANAMQEFIEMKASSLAEEEIDA